VNEVSEIHGYLTDSPIQQIIIIMIIIIIIIIIIMK